MRLNPFSNRIGRRRAALTGDAFENDDMMRETEEPQGENATDQVETSEEAEQGKRFGFAYQRSPEQPSPANMPSSETEPESADHHPASEALPSGADPAPSDQPFATTPHIDRLRAEIGTDAAKAIEPWLPAKADTPQPSSPPGPAPAPDLDMPLHPRRDEQSDPAHPPHSERPHWDAAPSPSPASLPVSDDAPYEAPPREEVIPQTTEPDQTFPEPDIDPIDDVAVTIGRIVSIRGSVIWGALFDDIDGHAARAARMGALVSMKGPDSRVFGIVNRLEREQQMGNTQSERTVFEIQVLGEIADDRTGFQRGVSSYPPLDAPVTTITIRDIATIYARPRSSNVHIGQLRHNPKVPAFVLTDSLLGKHFAVLGTTGTGKSCATTVILRSILDEHPEGHVILIDPHNEYGPAFADRAELLHPGNLQLPYWLLNFEEIAHVVLHGASREQLHSQGALLKSAIIQAKNQFAGGHSDDNQITVDTPVPYRLSDLVSILKEGMGTFNKAEGAAHYLSLINRIESLRSDKRFAFMFSSIAVRDNMEQVLAQLLRIPTHGKPITIIDISGLPSDVVDVVVSVLFRLTFELAVWSERGKAPPVLLVCEEAHRYVPENSDVGFTPTKRVIAQIAKEGRKYGVTLCLVSQRPSELAVSSLAQCNTVFALRMSNEHDQAFVSQNLSENARWLVDSLPSLNTQEAVVVGDGVTVPVHIRFKNLLPQHRPASHDPSFAKSWCQEADAGFLQSAIDRWRRQAR
jgi:DNA helicase HerA-like ATPase